MEVTAGLKCAAVTVELVGTAFGLIAKIKQTVETARQNKLEYDHLKGRLPTIGDVLHRLPADAEAERPLAELIKLLQQAYDLIIACQKRSAAKQFFRARKHADRLRAVNARIDSHLSLFPLISYAALARRLDDKQGCSCAGSPAPQKGEPEGVFLAERDILGIFPSNHTGEVPGYSSAGSLQKVEDMFVAERDILEILPPNHTGEAPVCSSAGSQQKVEDVFVAQRKILEVFPPNYAGEMPGSSYASSLQKMEDVFVEQCKILEVFPPKHAGEMPGCSSAGSLQKVEDVLVAQRKILEMFPPNHTSKMPGCSSAGSLQNVHDASQATRKILEMFPSSHTSKMPVCSSAGPLHDVGDAFLAERKMLVYEHGHVSNTTLRDHLVHGVSSSSPVTVSWRTRLEVLLGVSRSIENLHRCAIIHGNVSSSNICLDDNWTPRLSGFSDDALQADQLIAQVVCTPGYIDPEYRRTGCMSPASDVYSFGVVILEALTGRPPVSGSWEKGEDVVTLVDSMLPVIRDGNLRGVLDGRPVLPMQPMLRYFEALMLVTHTARLCLCPHGKDRPAMSNVVANLENVLDIIRSNAPMKVL